MKCNALPKVKACSAAFTFGRLCKGLPCCMLGSRKDSVQTCLAVLGNSLCYLVLRLGASKAVLRADGRHYSSFCKKGL